MSRRWSRDEAIEAVQVLVAFLCAHRDGEGGVREPWVAKAEVEAYASVSGDTVDRWVQSGVLPEGRRGGVVRYRLSDVDALLLAGGATEGSPSNGDTESQIEATTARVLRSLKR